MFDRFTDRARKVMGLAKAQAERLNHEYIGTEHILLGLIQEGSSNAVKILGELNIDPKRVRSEIEKIVKGSPDMVTHTNLPFTPRAKRVLELSVEEASVLGHDYLGTEHLLLGLLKENEGIAARVLTNLGLELDVVRTKVRELPSGATTASAHASPADDRDLAPRKRDFFKPFTDRARRVMKLAQDESKRLNHEFINTEHLLLGLVAEGTGVAAHVLKQMDVDLKRVRSELEKLVGQSPSVKVRGNMPYTPRAKAALEYAVDEARGLGHSYVGTEHLLLGLVREGQGIAACILQNLGVNLSDLRTEVLEFIGADRKSFGPAGGNDPGASWRADANDSTTRTRERLELLGAKVARDDPAAIPPLLVRRSDLRIGVVGSGSLVLNAHLPAYVKWGLRVTAITDVRSEAAEDAARRYGVPTVCTDLDELLALEDVDVVDVAVPEFERQRLLPKLLKAGKPVLLQKPLAESLVEARKIVDDFARAKIPLAVNQNLRWSPEMQAAKHLIAGGHLGQVFDLRWTTRSTADRRPSAKEIGYFGRKRFQVLTGSEHPLDAFRFLLEDEAIRVYCALPRRPDQNFTGDVCASAVIHFRRGGHASLVDSNASTPGRPDTHVLDVDGTGGSLTFGLAAPRYFAYWLAKEIPGGASGEGEAPAHAPPLAGDWYPDGFAGSMASFLEAIEAGTEAPTSGRRNLGTMALVDACYRSAESGQAVDVPLVD